MLKYAETVRILNFTLSANKHISYILVRGKNHLNEIGNSEHSDVALDFGIPQRSSTHSISNESVKGFTSLQAGIKHYHLAAGRHDVVARVFCENGSSSLNLFDCQTDHEIASCIFVVDQPFSEKRSTAGRT